MENANTILKQVFGHTAFRAGQEDLIRHILHGQDVLGIMPTGAGKSLCYQVPALAVQGITLVISPLISLMKDQVNALTQQGVGAAYLNSSLTAAQYRLALQRAKAGQYRIIYVAPERLFTEDFQRFCAGADIAMVTVDEAHCVSQWGQDFRPGYLKIAAFVAGLPKRPRLSAFTATATARVREDIVRLLELRDPHIVTTGFDRPNLYFAVRQPKNKIAGLLAFLEDSRERCGIVYCATRKNVEAVCEVLNQSGFAATCYHAGLGAAQRRDNQDDFLFDRKQIMVATNAFGMGIDKSDVRFVVHYNMPKNIESYYQEAGRAGRDGEKAVCLLLYSPQDVRTQQFLIEHGQADNDDLTPTEKEALRQNDLELLKQMTFLATTTECLRHFVLRYFGETPAIFCDNCSNCHTHYEEVDISTPARKIISCVVRIERQGRRFGKGMVANVLHGSNNQRIRDNHLDTLSTFGIMADTPVPRIGDMIDYLAQNDLLAFTDGEYPTLASSADGMAFLAASSPLMMKLPKKKQPRQSTAKKAAKATLSDVDTELLQALKALRLQLAKTASVPAYVVFSDATLVDMCHKRPTNTEAFLEVSGVGQEKMRRYGKAFTDLIREYGSRHG